MNQAVRAMLALLLVCAGVAVAEEPLPPSLRDWQGWVLRGEGFRRCPALANAAATDGTAFSPGFYRCVWPERLALDVDAHGGTFTQRWQVFDESWVELPGDTEHWPRDVKLNGAPAPVIGRGESPLLRLPAGNYTITGRFEWRSRPETLALPGAIALVDLTVDGQRVAQPERPGGALWLGKRRSAEQVSALEVQVYRLVRDDIPTYLVTRIRLNVAGDAREELLAHVLPDGFTPLSLTGSLPARLERDGRLRVQLRPGTHDIELAARAAGVVDALARPAKSEGTWARDEIWSFAAADSLRVVTAEGAEGIDPAQASVPSDWRQFPAFRMAAGTKLAIVERSRGLSVADDNRLQLHRRLWLDFDHGGFTVVDDVGGLLRRDWRLDMAKPFVLASARQGGEQLLVTEGAAGGAGIELREPRLALSTIARKDESGGSMPATGWTQRFEQVSGTLFLPPGHRLLGVLGPDSAPGSWWDNWGLWNVFGVLIIVAFVFWTAGRVPAAIAALALVLTYQEAPFYIWLWGNLLAALAIARAAPAGDFRKFAHIYRTVSFAVLGIALLPFLWLQVRLALYPQLETPRYSASTLANPQNGYAVGMRDSDGSPLGDLLGGRQRLPPPISADLVQEIAPQSVNVPTQSVAPAPPPAPDEMEESAAAPMTFSAPADAIATTAPALPETRVSNPYKVAGLNSLQVVQRYAAGTVLQAGPGLPAWSFNSYDYSWTGTVEPTDSVRFIYIGPTSMFFWRLAGVITLVVLFLWLALLSFGGRWKLPRIPGERATAAAQVPAMLLPLIAFAALAASPVRAQANSEPDAPESDVLRELHDRLIAAPVCAPTCATIVAAHVLVEGDRLDVTLDVSALSNVAVAMPHANDRWQIESVTVDARGSIAIVRDSSDQSLYLPLATGAHVVRLAGRLASAESIQLAFPERPRTIDVSARGWAVTGMNEGRLVAGSLELARERSAQRADTPLEASSEFPAFVNVERAFNLDLDWTMTTVVSRIAPHRAALSVEIPLVAGESVLTPGVEVRNGAALVGLGTGEQQSTWQSGLPHSESFEVALPAGSSRAETWSFRVNPQWNVAFAGFPSVLPADINARYWVFRYIPRPGETLKVTISRPKPVAGATLAIDGVALTTTVAERSSDSQLRFSVRSTQGGRHVIKLPVDARVTSVKVDSRPVQLRPENGELPLSLTPGEHVFEIDWREPGKLGFRTSPPEVDLGSPASNLRHLVRLPASRWPLFASGPGVGPAVLYWGELAVFVALAWLLGRWSKSPLRFTEWLLLGVGLSTQSWFVFSITAAWLIVMRWREGWNPDAEFTAAKFNAVQTLLAVFTVIVMSLLVFSGIRNGLLAAPDMGIEGPYSSGGFFWFQDQTTRVLEAPSVWSVPMLVYRLLFFAWALWMAFALVRWLRWAFNAWKGNGLWR